MIQKPVIAIQSRNQIYIRICDFFTKEVNPSEYSPTDEAETKMQLHFSDCLSNGHGVLREVSIPKCCDIEGCGEKTWETYASSRGLARGISAAYRAWEREEKAAKMSNPYSRAIASVYTNQYGQLAWWL